MKNKLFPCNIRLTCGVLAFPRLLTNVYHIKYHTHNLLNYQQLIAFQFLVVSKLHSNIVYRANHLFTLIFIRNNSQGGIFHRILSGQL